MLLLVLACAIIRRSNIVMILRTPHRRAQITFRFWRKADMPKNAIDVAIGGKADMAYCSAYVRL
jgi:hypothetical protein